MRTARRPAPGNAKKGKAGSPIKRVKVPAKEVEEEVGDAGGEEFVDQDLLTYEDRRMARDIVALLRETIIPRNVKLRAQLGLQQRGLELPSGIEREVSSRGDLAALSQMAEEIKLDNIDLFRTLSLAVESSDSTVAKDRGTPEVLHSGVFEVMNARHASVTAAPNPPRATLPSGGGHLLHALEDDSFTPFEEEELAHTEQLRLLAADLQRIALEDEANKAAGPPAAPSPARRNSSVLVKKERRESVKVAIGFHKSRPTAAEILEQLKAQPAFMQPKILLKSKRAAGIEQRNVEKGHIATTLAAVPLSSSTVAAVTDASVRHEILSSRSRRVVKAGEAGQAPNVPRYMAAPSTGKLPLTKRTLADEKSWSELARFSSQS